MSYHTWSVDGYGFSVTDLEKIIEFPRIEFIINHTPESYQQEIKSFIKEDLTSDNWKESLNEWAYYDEESIGSGLGVILKKWLEKQLDIPLTLCDNFDGEVYLLYEPSYPWVQTPREKATSFEFLTYLYKNSIKKVTNEEILVDYFSVENGG